MDIFDITHYLINNSWCQLHLSTRCVTLLKMKTNKIPKIPFKNRFNEGIVFLAQHIFTKNKFLKNRREKNLNKTIKYLNSQECNFNINIDRVENLTEEKYCCDYVWVEFSRISLCRNLQDNIKSLRAFRFSHWQHILRNINFWRSTD